MKIGQQQATSLVKVKWFYTFVVLNDNRVTYTVPGTDSQEVRRSLPRNTESGLHGMETLIYEDLPGDSQED